MFNHEIAYLIPNSPFAQYQYFFSSISYPFITSFCLCQFAQYQYQLFPSLTFLLICTIPIPSPSFLSQNIFLFNFFTHLLLFLLHFFSYLTMHIYFYLPLPLLPSFSGLLDSLFKLVTFFCRWQLLFFLLPHFFFTVNNLQYDRPHNFII